MRPFICRINPVLGQKCFLGGGEQTLDERCTPKGFRAWLDQVIMGQESGFLGLAKLGQTDR